MRQGSSQVKRPVHDQNAASISAGLHLGLCIDFIHILLKAVELAQLLVEQFANLWCHLALAMSEDAWLLVKAGAQSHELANNLGLYLARK